MQRHAHHPQAAPFAVPRLGAPGRLQGLLVTRFALFNLLGLVALTVAWRHGYIGEVVAADASGISLLIAAVFAWTLAIGAWRAWQLSGELDRLQAGEPASAQAAYRAAMRRGIEPAVAAEALKSKLYNRLSTARHAGAVMVTLGLVGTVVGFVMALSGVEPTQVGDVSAIGPMVAHLVAGMGVALYTTLVGALLGVWSTLNYRLLAAGAAQLYTSVLETEPCSTKRQAPSSATW